MERSNTTNAAHNMEEVRLLRIEAFKKFKRHKVSSEEERELIYTPSEVVHKFVKIESGGQKIEIPIDLPSLG